MIVVGPLYSDSMLNDVLSLVSWRSRPRSFVALMSLYESNYLRLAQLAGDLKSLADVRVSRVADDCDLRLTRHRTFAVHHQFRPHLSFPKRHDGVTTYPDMRVRVYHDARLVEAQEWATQHEHEALAPPARRWRSVNWISVGPGIRC